MSITPRLIKSLKESNAAPLAMNLAPKGEVPTIGAENGTVMPQGVSKLSSPHGSVRYVYAVGGEIVGALQLVTLDGKNARIANVYVKTPHRRKGIATKLYQQATKDFQSIKHSDDINTDGKAWRDGLNELFDQGSVRPYELHKNSGGISNPGGFAYFTTSSGTDYDVKFIEKLTGVTHVLFYESDAAMKPHEFDNTEKFEQMEVLATVQAILIDYIKKYQPKEVRFHTDKNNNRSGVYGRMIARGAKELKPLGYRTYQTRHGVLRGKKEFVITTLEEASGRLSPSKRKTLINYAVSNMADMVKDHTRQGHSINRDVMMEIRDAAIRGAMETLRMPSDTIFTRDQLQRLEKDIKAQWNRLYADSLGFQKELEKLKHGKRESRLSELFDSGSVRKFTFRSKSADRWNMHAVFETSKGNRYVVNFFRWAKNLSYTVEILKNLGLIDEDWEIDLYEEIVEVSFVLESSDDFEATNKHEQMEVFTTVGAITEEYVKKYTPHVLFYVTNKSGKRNSIYRKMIKRLSSKNLDYEFREFTKTSNTFSTLVNMEKMYANLP